MKRQHEQSIIDAFKEIFYLKCNQLGEAVYLSASLDGQDNHLGADYLFSLDTKFILIEFKYEKGDIKDEKNKLLRKCLCESFDLEKEYIDKDKFNKHIQCHFISWSDKYNNDRKIFIGNYAEFVCLPVFGIVTPCKKNVQEKEASIFIEDFILSKQKIGLTFNDFNLYIEWLLETCSSLDSDNRSIELIISNPNNPTILSEFNNLHELNNFILELKRNNLDSKPDYPKPKF